MAYKLSKKDDQLIFSNGEDWVKSYRKDDRLWFKSKNVVISYEKSDLLAVHQIISTMGDYDDPEMVSSGLSILPIDGGYEFMVYGKDSLILKQSDVPEFRKFMGKILKIVEEMLKTDKSNIILEATEKYVDEMQQFNISVVAETLLQFLKMDEFYVFEYPGVLPLHYKSTPEEILEYKKYGSKKLLKSIYKENKKYRYNVGIFSVEKEGDHYLVFIMDTQIKRIWVFDSLSSSALLERKEFPLLLKTFFPAYTIDGVNVCSGCQKYEPLASDLRKLEYVDQNIFCHTWCLWFIYQFASEIKQGVKVEKIMDGLNNSCKTPRENLKRIKQFAHWLSYNILEIELPDKFKEIYNPKHIIASGGAKSLHEYIDNVGENPPLVFNQYHLDDTDLRKTFKAWR